MTDTPILRADPYCGPAPRPEDLLAAWNLDPVLLTILALTTALALWRLRAEPGRRRAAVVAAGAAVVAFVSPLCALTVALFAARGLHHLALILALAPALAVIFPLRARPGRALSGTAAFVALSAALWAWHLPPVYAAAWDHSAVYWALQGALLLSAWAFWRAILHAPRHIAAQLNAGALLAGLAGQMGLIGAILTFAPGVLFPEHLATTTAYGLDALRDQQLAGLVMWVPGMLPLAGAGAWLVHRAWDGAPDAAWDAAWDGAGVAARDAHDRDASDQNANDRSWRA